MSLFSPSCVLSLYFYSITQILVKIIIGLFIIIVISLVINIINSDSDSSWRSFIIFISILPSQSFCQLLYKKNYKCLGPVQVRQAKYKLLS